MALRIVRVSALEDRGFGGLAAEYERDPVQRGLVAGSVNEMPFRQLGIESLGERCAQVESGQLKRPAAQRVAVVIDGSLVLPRREQRHCGVALHDRGRGFSPL